MGMRGDATLTPVRGGYFKKYLHFLFIDPEVIAFSVVRTESLRLMADYPGTALDAKTAADTVGLQLRTQSVGGAKATGHSKGADRCGKEDQNHSVDDELDE